jgi:hypothetical protein
LERTKDLLDSANQSAILYKSTLSMVTVNIHSLDLSSI